MTLNYFFIEPRHRLTISDSENVVALGVFLIAAVVVGRLALPPATRTVEAEVRAREAAAREREAELLAAAGSAVLAGTDIETQLENVGATVGASSGASSCALELASGPSAPRRVRGSPAHRDPARLALRRAGRRLGQEAASSGSPRRSRGSSTSRSNASGSPHQSAEAEATRRADVAKTALLHAISHDLRSPLTAITTAAGAPARRPRRRPTTERSWSAVIEAESARLARLVDDLLDLSRIEAGAVDPRTDWCDLQRVARAPRPHVRSRAASIRSSSICPPTCRSSSADAAQLERVFANLLENAVQFSPDGAPVRISGGAGGGRVTIRVIDRGRGIPPRQRAADLRALLPRPRRSRQRLGPRPGDLPRLRRGQRRPDPAAEPARPRAPSFAVSLPARRRSRLAAHVSGERPATSWSSTTSRRSCAG